MAPFVTKRGSLRDPLELTLLGRDGSPIDLSSVAEATLYMRDPVEDIPAIINGPLEILDAPQGRVRYHWVTQDLDIEGVYFGEVRLEWPDGLVQRVPNKDYYIIEIQRDLEMP